MKTILAPTDFSNVSTNAVMYAAEMAKQLKAKLTLFHVCYIPVPTQDIPVEPFLLNDLEDSARENLKKLAEKLLQLYEGELMVDYSTSSGFAVDEIKSFAQECNADLIVMGMQGKGYLGEKIVGSVTTSLIRKAQLPVMVISDGVTFKTIKKIVLASDSLKEDTNDSLLSLKEIADASGAHVYVINVIKQDLSVPSSPKEIIDFNALDKQFSGITHSVHFWRGENPVDGINQFISENHMDMVVMIPAKRPFFNALFHASNTKRMAFHTKVPMLVLHEKSAGPDHPIKHE